MAQGAAQEGSMEIEVDAFPFFTAFKGGFVRRYNGTETVPPSPEKSSDGVKSKDSVVNQDNGIYVRMFLPTAPADARMPVLFYVHGGGFCIESPSSPTYHGYMTSVAAHVRALCVSVHYRRTPEHRLPAAYEDCFEALQWLLLGNGRDDPWVAACGNLSQLFVAGDSCGANIVHELGLRARRVEWGTGVRFCGAVSVHPAFCGEVAEDNLDEIGRHLLRLTANGVMFKSALPEGEKDLSKYPPFNPTSPISPPPSELVYERMLVAVAGKDPLREIGRRYYRWLEAGGVDVELYFELDEGHVFHLFSPQSAVAASFMQRVCKFIHDTCSET